jgi:hypothetical protein
MQNRMSKIQSHGIPVYGSVEPAPSVDLGPDSAGQSGDLQGLSNSPEADSESVAQLLAEGQSYEASIIQGLEDAGDDETKELETSEDSRERRERSRIPKQI